MVLLYLVATAHDSGPTARSYKRITFLFLTIVGSVSGAIFGIAMHCGEPRVDEVC